MLYFENLSRDSANAYLADGLTEELIIQLTQIRRLEVKSRFESMRARAHATMDPRALGFQLHAAYLITGSLQQAGQRMRFRVSLVRSSNGAQVWGDVYDRAGDDVLGIQSEVARAVVSAIVGRLLPTERTILTRRATKDAVAYDLYLRGVGAMNAVSEPALRVGLSYLDRAIARDSTFAQAYAYKALAWSMLADGYVEPREGNARSREAAEQALRRDPSISLAHAMLAFAVLAVDHDPRQGLEIADRAVALDPRSSLGHDARSVALHLARRGADSVLAEARLGWEADTLSEVAAYLYVWWLHRLRRTDSLSATVNRMHGFLATDDNRTFDGLVRLLRGDPAGAAERLSWSYYGGDVAGEYVRALLGSGRRQAALAVLDSIRDFAAKHYYNPYGIAKVYAALGQADSAFAWLDRAYDQRTVWLIAADADVGFESLHADQRWHALLRRLGFSP